MMSGAFRAVVTASAAAAVAIAAYGDRPLLIAAVAAICGLFSVGWPILLGLPAPRGAATVLLLCSMASIAAVEWTHEPAWVALVLAGSVLAAFVHELARRDGRPRLVESVAGVIGGAIIVSSAALWLAMGTDVTQVSLLLTGSVSIATASTLTAVPIAQPYSSVVTIVVTALVGLGLGYLLVTVGTMTGLSVGIAAGLLCAAVHHLFGQFPASGRAWAALSAAMLAVAVAGLPVYVLGRVLPMMAAVAGA